MTKMEKSHAAMLAFLCKICRKSEERQESGWRRLREAERQYQKALKLIAAAEAAVRGKK
jgi:hypothetical protein